MLYLRQVIVFVLCVGTGLAQAEWPQFQGPDRNGHSRETGIAKSWPETGPKTLWTVPVGEGFGGAAVSAGEVYFLDRISGQEDIFRCLSLDTGEELWRYSYPAESEVSYPGSRTVPTVTDKHVYTVGVLGDFHCFDRETGKVVWHHNLVEDYDLGGPPRWGISQAPAVSGDLVVVAPQASDALLAAYNRFTGERVWTSVGIGGLGYVSPVIKTLHGVEQVLMVSAPGRRQPGTVAGIALADGEVLWRYEEWACRIPIPYPTVLPGNRVFITGGYGAGSHLFEVSKVGEDWSTKKVFETMDFGSQIHQPLFVDGVLFGNSNSNDEKDGMVCLTLDGTREWRTRDDRSLPNFDFGNLIYVDGLIVNFEGRRGTLHLVEPSTEGYNELASASIFRGNKMWAPMAFSDGKLVLRSQGEMTCLDLVNP